MKTRITLTTILFAGILILNACDSINNVRPSDQVSTQSYNFTDYDRIETESAFKVFLTISDSEEIIEIEANDNLHQYIEVTEQSGTLKIGFRNNVGITGPATLNAYVTTNDVTSFSASGASRFMVDGDVKGESVSIYLSGASRYSGTVDTDELSMDISGASIVDVTGSAQSAYLRASGASSFDGYGFSTLYANFDFSGASNAAITVTEEMDVSASGASVIRYKGPAMVKSLNLSGGSQLLNMN